MNTGINQVTSFEDLSNELLYEIFEYLPGWDLYDAFSKLNFRFQRLLSDLPLLLKIQLDSSLKSKMEYYCNNFYIPNKHNILSLHFDQKLIVDTFLAHCMIDSSFDRLETVMFNELRVDQFMMILFYLKSLPRLFSLDTILINKRQFDPGNIYRMIFSLPALKYNRLMIEPDDTDKVLPISLHFAVNERFSTIEYLIISHECTTWQLFSIIRHTPQLRHLTCKDLLGSDIDDEQLLKLFHLKYFSIESASIAFTEFERIIQSFSTQLEIVRIHHYDDEEYFDADRWERLIQNDIPHLQKLDYKYYNYDSFLHLKNVAYTKMNQFTSPFWTKRSWFFEAEIHSDAIAYSICSHKKRWFDYDNKQANTDRPCNQSIELNRDIHLFIGRELLGIDQRFIDKYKIVFDCVKFTHLIIDYPTISNEMLVKLLQLLPNLDSLKVSSLQSTQPDCSNDNLVDMSLYTPIKNKITKVCLKKSTHLNEVKFLLHLCSSMEHFRIHVVEKLDLKSLLCLILGKTDVFVPRLRSLCLCTPNADDVITHQLQNLIESEGLLFKYMIKRCGNQILLQW